MGNVGLVLALLGVKDVKFVGETVGVGSHPTEGLCTIGARFLNCIMESQFAHVFELAYVEKTFQYRMNWEVLEHDRA
jgi:hypothetical protein